MMRQLMLHLGLAAGFAGICNIRGGLALSRVPMELPLRSRTRTPTNQYGFIAHAKTGTKLSTKIGREMTTLLGMPNCEVNYVMQKSDVTCVPETVTVYADYIGPSLKAFKKCPDMRAVHIVRRPSTVLMSYFAYIMDLTPEQYDWKFWGGFSKSLHSFPLPRAFNITCWQWLDMSGRHLHHTFEYMQRKAPDNVLQLKLEEFTANSSSFDNTTRAIYQHFLGSSNSSLIESLVQAASKHDLNRIPPSVQDKMSHVSSVDLEAAAGSEFQRQFQEGGRCMKMVAEMDTQLGYEPLYF